HRAVEARRREPDRPGKERGASPNAGAPGRAGLHQLARRRRGDGLPVEGVRDLRGPARARTRRGRRLDAGLAPRAAPSELTMPIVDSSPALSAARRAAASLLES